MGLIDFLKGAGKLNYEMFPEWNQDDGATEGLAGHIRDMGRGIEALDLEMTGRTSDLKSLKKLAEDGYLSKKEIASIARRITHS